MIGRAMDFGMSVCCQCSVVVWYSMSADASTEVHAAFRGDVK